MTFASDSVLEIGAYLTIPIIIDHQLVTHFNVRAYVVRESTYAEWEVDLLNLNPDATNYLLDDRALLYYEISLD